MGDKNGWWNTEEEDVLEEKEVNELTKEAAFEIMGDEEWEYFVAFVDEDDIVVHLVGYGSRPNVAALRYLLEELETDSEFGMPREFLDILKVRIFNFK